MKTIVSITKWPCLIAKKTEESCNEENKIDVIETKSYLFGGTSEEILRVSDENRNNLDRCSRHRGSGIHKILSFSQL